MSEKFIKMTLLLNAFDLYHSINLLQQLQIQTFTNIFLYADSRVKPSQIFSTMLTPDSNLHDNEVCVQWNPVYSQIIASGGS